MDSQIQVLEGLGMYGAIEEVNVSGLAGLGGTSLANVDGIFSIKKPDGSLDVKKIAIVGGVLAALGGAFFLYKKGKLPFFKKSPAAALYGLNGALASLGGRRRRRRRR